MKDQLSKEMQQKQSFIARTSQKSDEIKDIRSKLSDSLNSVARESLHSVSREPSILQRESMKLDETAEQHSVIDASSAYYPSSTPYYGHMRRTKSSSPTSSIMSPEKLKFSGMTMTPTTDPGISPPKRTTPITAGLRRSGMGPRTPSSHRASRKDL